MECKKILFVSEGADLDELSSALAVLELFPDSCMLKPKLLSRKASYVFKKYKDLFRVTEELPEEFTLVLTDRHEAPEIEKDGRIKDKLVFDHHPVEGKLKGRVDKVGSATTLVVEELIKREVKLSPEKATVIALGIYEDTGNLTYAGTTPRDLKALAWLMEQGADVNTIREILSESYTKEQIEAISKIVSSVETLFMNGKKVAVATAVLEEYQPDINPLLYEIRELKEANAFFVIIEAEGKTYVFGRSKDKDIDVGKILTAFGGGGHEEASAVKLENVSARRIKELIVKFVRDNYLPKIYVRDIMSSPPFVLSEHLSVSDALAELSDRGFANAPVIDREGNTVGIISKKALLKLSKLYPEEPIGEFANKDYYTLPSDAPVWEAEEILTKYGQKLIPVEDKGAILGVVTRIDILQTIKEDMEQLKASKKKVKLPRNVKPLAEEIGKVSRELGYRVYIVGGAVRDILLGKDIWDIDFVVEGDAVKLAEEVAKRHGVKTHPFPEFGTSHVKVEELKLEFATARRETYERPGAYPHVEQASVKEDLIRRDFTINAMAISLNEDYGTLIDYFGGIRDLKDKMIRVLHPVSFIEDPVRILRALRFSGRFGFKLSKSTEKLLKQAVNLGLLEESARGRLMNEVRLALREDRLLEILRLYRRYKIFEHLIKGFQWTQKLEDRLLKLRKVVNWHSLEFPHERIDYGWVYLLLLLSEVKPEVSREFLEDISAPSNIRRFLNFAQSEVYNFKRNLEKAEKPSEIYRLLKPLQTVELLILMTCENVTDKVKIYMEGLRDFKLEKEDIDSLKSKGYEGRELGMKIEELKREAMDRYFSEKLSVGG